MGQTTHPLAAAAQAPTAPAPAPHPPRVRLPPPWPSAPTPPCPGPQALHTASHRPPTRFLLPQPSPATSPRQVHPSASPLPHAPTPLALPAPSPAFGPSPQTSSPCSLLPTATAASYNVLGSGPYHPAAPAYAAAASPCCAAFSGESYPPHCLSPKSPPSHLTVQQVVPQVGQHDVPHVARAVHIRVQRNLRRRNMGVCVSVCVRCPCQHASAPATT